MQIFPKYFLSIKLESMGTKGQPYSHRKEKPPIWVMMQRVGNVMKLLKSFPLIASFSEK